MSSNRSLENHDFDDLIAAVDSIDNQPKTPDEFSEFNEYFNNDLPAVNDLTLDTPPPQQYVHVATSGLSLETEPFSPTVQFGRQQESLLDGFNEFDELVSAAEAATLMSEQHPAQIDGASNAHSVPSNPIQIPTSQTTEQVVANEAHASQPVTPAVFTVDNRVHETPDLHPQRSGAPISSYIDKPNDVEAPGLFSLHGFAKRLPKAYLAMSLLMALLGFVYILLVPVLFGYTTIQSFEFLNSPMSESKILFLLGGFSLSLFLFLFSYRLFDLKFLEPEGITLDEENADQFIEKLHALRGEFRFPKIHQIVLTRRHELNVIKVPRFGFPLWSKNVLAIGYPLLQTLSPEYFDCALKRRLIQFSKRRNVLLNWLSFMRRTWTLYACSLKHRKGVLDLIHYCFFAPYASLYRRFAVYISQQDELLADEMALRHCNDRDLLKTVQTIRITQDMLVQYFWPKLNAALKDHSVSPVHVRPYFNLPGILADLLNSKDINTWFIRLGQETFRENHPEPPFAARMKQMGHTKVSIPAPFETSAAHFYFDELYDEMTDLMDELWAEEVQHALFMDNITQGKLPSMLPLHLAIEAA